MVKNINLVKMTDLARLGQSLGEEKTMDLIEKAP